MKVLVACEYSGTVRDAFTRAGHWAVSCDMLPSESPGWHYQGDVTDILDDEWDLMIAHPPCTHLAVSGARHFAAKEAAGVQQQEARPDHSAVAVWAWRDKGHMPVAKEPSPAEADEYRRRQV